MDKGYTEYEGDAPVRVYPIGSVGSSLNDSQSSRLPLSDQEKALNNLHETIDKLQHKLTAVLQPTSPRETEGMERGAKDEEQSPLAEQLKANNNGIRFATQKLEEIIGRIEC